MNRVLIAIVSVFLGACSQSSTTPSEPILSDQAAASFAYLVDFPKGEMTIIKKALVALDGKLALKERSNVFIQKSKTEIEVVFYPVPNYENSGPNGTYTVKVFLDPKSLLTIRTEERK
jgi:hypothetical protein